MKKALIIMLTGLFCITSCNQTPSKDYKIIIKKFPDKNLITSASIIFKKDNINF